MIRSYPPGLNYARNLLTGEPHCFVPGTWTPRYPEQWAAWTSAGLPHTVRRIGETDALWRLRKLAAGINADNAKRREAARILRVYHANEAHTDEFQEAFAQAVRLTRYGLGGATING